MADVVAEIEHLQEKINEKRSTAEHQSAQFETANEAYSEVNQAIQDKQAELEPKKQEYQEIDDEWKQTKAALMHLKVCTCFPKCGRLC